MSNKVYCPNRAEDILDLFVEHGPLSISTLSAMLKPPMKIPKIRKSLYRLVKKGILKSSKYNGLKSFYYISQNAKSINYLCEKYKLTPEQLNDPGIHGREWIHNEICEYWIFLLKKCYPTCRIVREKDFDYDDFAKRAIIVSENEPCIRPDFLLILPESNDLRLVIIAFEIERTKKQKNRLMEKLIKYADRSFVDGVIYICSSEEILNAISKLFQTQIMFDSLRIGNYGEKFILFSDNFNTRVTLVDSFFDVTGNRLNFLNWIEYLKTTPPHLRNNKMSLGG